MLDHALREQLLRLFEGLEASYVFDVTADPGHASRGELLELLEERRDKSGIVYCATRKGVEQICELLQSSRDSSSGFCATRRTPASTSGQCPTAMNSAR